MALLTINVTHSYPELEKMNRALEHIRLEVEEAKSAQASAVALIKGLKTSIDELTARAVDIDALKSDLASLSADLSSATDGLAAAVANVDEPVVVPVDEPTPAPVDEP